MNITHYCDHLNCDLPATAESIIYDEDGEDQGTELLCKNHKY
jgi:hypothetical protein